MSKHPLDFLSGGGEMGALLRSHDWASTPLGDPNTWPQSLRTAVRLMLNTRHPIFIFWGEDGLCFYNDAYRQSIGPERHPSAIGRPAFDVWAEIWPIIGPQIKQVMAGKGATWHENHLVPITRYGRYEDVYWTYSYGPIDDENSPTGVGGVLVVCTETTQAVLAARRYRFLTELGDLIRNVTTPEQVLAHTASMLGQHLKASCVGYADVDPSGEHAVVDNDWTAEGCASVVGRHRLDQYGKAMSAELRAGRTVRVNDTTTSLLTAGAETGKAFAQIHTRAFIDVPIVKRGSLVGLLFVLSETPRDWGDNEVLLIEDVAERTWEAVERCRAESALRQTDRRKDEFLAMLAHELRNPLAPISAAAELLKLIKPDEARLKHTSDIIGRQVRHMTSLVDDLLDVSRVTRGLVELDMVPVDIKHIVNDAVEQVNPLIHARRHHLVMRVPPESAKVTGDAKRLVQILANLLTNAAKYTPEGGHIVLTTEVHERRVVLRVQDNGVGIAPELVTRIFDLFAQAERTSDRSSGGLGLGLALVKSLVELHGGTVECASEGIGRGSMFTVCLPRLPEPDEHPDRHTEHPHPDSARRSLKVMVVDDNVDAAQMLAMVLEASAHKVIMEHDSMRALARARTEAPQVCLIDIGLPGIDGNELAKRLRAEPATAGAVLIAITGYGQEHDRQKSFAAGFDHHMVKPVDLAKLTAMLADLSAA